MVSVEYDTDAHAAQRSRRAMLQLAASEHLLVGAAHISFPGLGRMRANGNTCEWIPVNYEGDPGRRQDCSRKQQDLSRLLQSKTVPPQTIRLIRLNNERERT